MIPKPAKMPTQVLLFRTGVNFADNLRINWN